MIAWFKRKRPQPEPQRVTTEEDIFIAHAWGLKLTEWWAMSDFERRECRRTITTAPRFGVNR